MEGERETVSSGLALAGGACGEVFWAPVPHCSCPQALLEITSEDTIPAAGLRAVSQSWSYHL